MVNQCSSLITDLMQSKVSLNRKEGPMNPTHYLLILQPTLLHLQIGEPSHSKELEKLENYHLILSFMGNQLTILISIRLKESSSHLILRENMMISFIKI